MIKYKTYHGEITKHDIVRETAHCVYVKGNTRNCRKEDKHSKYIDWFDTWQEASDFLKQRRVELGYLTDSEEPLVDRKARINKEAELCAPVTDDEFFERYDRNNNIGEMK